MFFPALVIENGMGDTRFFYCRQGDGIANIDITADHLQIIERFPGITAGIFGKILPEPGLQRSGVLGSLPLRVEESFVNLLLIKIRG